MAKTSPSSLTEGAVGQRRFLCQPAPSVARALSSKVMRNDGKMQAPMPIKIDAQMQTASVSLRRHVLSGQRKAVTCPVSVFPVGLLDFEVDVVLARLEADFSDQQPSVPAMPSRRVSLQCPTTKYPRSAQPPSIPAVPKRRVSLQCRTAEYPCSAQPPQCSILTVPNRKVSLQCPTAKYPCSAQLQNIPAVSNPQISLQCPTAEYPGSAQQQSINILAAHLQCCKEDS